MHCNYPHPKFLTQYGICHLWIIAFLANPSLVGDVPMDHEAHMMILLILFKIYRHCLSEASIRAVCAVQKQKKYHPFGLAKKQGTSCIIGYIVYITDQLKEGLWLCVGIAINRLVMDEWICGQWMIILQDNNLMWSFEKVYIEFIKSSLLMQRLHAWRI